jgi:hypothetical protein
MIILRILIGFAIAVLGYFMVWKTTFFLNVLGPIAWADRNLGLGGTRLLYKLLGIAIIMIGFMVVTNLFDMVVGGFVASLFGGH